MICDLEQEMELVKVELCEKRMQVRRVSDGFIAVLLVFYEYMFS